MNFELLARVRAEIEQARAEGMNEDDIKWMAQGAALRFAREQGELGEDELPSHELQAAIALMVQQELVSAAIKKAVAARPRLGRFIVRELPEGVAERLTELGKSLDYSTREPFVRDVLVKVSLLSPEQIKQFLNLPLFL